MANYLVNYTDDLSVNMAERLSQVIPITTLNVGDLAQVLQKGDVFFVPGDALSYIGYGETRELFEKILIRGAHLIIHPPLPSTEFRWPWHEVENLIFQQVDYSPLNIIEEKLSRAINLTEISILYNLVFSAGFGHPLVVNARGEVVLSVYQHRSTWGQILCTTLLLSSTSLRSPKNHRSAFLQGLLSWLQSFSVGAVEVEESQPVKPVDLSYEISVILLVLHFFEGTQVEQTDLDHKIKWLQDRLGSNKVSFAMTAALSWLEDAKIITRSDKECWIIDVDKLKHELDQRRLWGYIRRLR